jgi:hypothetical protein
MHEDLVVEIIGLGQADKPNEPQDFLPTQRDHGGLVVSDAAASG